MSKIPKRKRWAQGQFFEMMPKLKAEFIAMYTQHPNISWCVEQMKERYSDFGGFNRQYVYTWLGADEEFAEDFDKAKKMSIRVLEAELHKRAVEGVDEPVYDKNGCIVGTKKKYSDRLLETALRATNPEKYGNKDKGIGDIEHVINLNLNGLVEDEDDDMDTSGTDIPPDSH